MTNGSDGPLPKEGGDTGGSSAAVVLRSFEVTTLSEEVSLINVREVEDWCDEVRGHRPRVMTATSGLAVCLGMLVGFLPALAATDRNAHGGWWGIFLFGSIVAVGGCVLCGVAVVLPVIGDIPVIRRWLGRAERVPMLEPLAARMDRACVKGRPIAAAAAKALQAQEKQE